MKEFNFYGCDTLDLNEVVSISGGSVAYDIGHGIGTAARDLLVGLLLNKIKIPAK
jgi:hypothetical protein